jgi:hypothetical protein
MVSRLSSRRRPGPITTNVGYCGRYQLLLRKTEKPQSRDKCNLRWDPGLRQDDSQRNDATPSNLAGGILLHPVGHLDQPPPRLLQKRHHAIHVAVARQRDFDVALTLGYLWLRFFQ